MDKIQALYNKREYQTSAQDINIIIHKDEIAKFKWFWSHSALDLKTASFFEIGPGSGTFFNFLQKREYGQYAACDINDNTIVQFGRFFPGQGNLVAKADALTALRGSPEKFDCILGMNVIEHFPSDYLADAFAIITERLNPSGELWFHAPSAESIVAMQNRYYDLTHRWSFVLHNFQALGDMHGLRLIAKSGKVIAVRDPKDALRWLHEKFLYLLNRFLFAFTIGTRAENGVFSAEICVILKKQGQLPIT